MTFDSWFSEQTLHDGGFLDKGMQLLEEGGYLARRENAVWFTSTRLGDDKDNVVVRSSGQPTLLRLRYCVPLPQIRQPQF